MNDFGMNFDEMNKAIQMFESMNETDLLLVRNELAMAYGMRGLSYFKDNEPNFAVQDLKKSIKIWESLINEGLPVNKEMLELAREIKIGLIPFSDEDKDEAIEHFNKGIDTIERLKNSNQSYDKSELANKYYYAAINHKQKKENKDAIAHFSKCIELLSEIDMQQIISDDLKILSSAYMCRGEIYFEVDKDDEALEDYNKAVALEELLQETGAKMSNYDIMDLVRLYTGRARILEYLKITEEAIDDFVTALRLNKLVFDDFVFREEQKDYYFYLDRLLDCLINENAELKRFGDVMQEFLYSMPTSKTKEVEEARNKILEKLKNRNSTQAQMNNLPKKVLTREDALKLRGEHFDIPYGYTEIDNEIFGGFSWYGSPTITDISFPESVTKIGDSAFENSYLFDIKNLTLSKNIIHIGKKAFRSVKIENLNIVGNVESFGEGAFSACLDLRKVILFGNVKSIGESAFAYCEKLSDVNLPNGLTSIGNIAFCNCDSLLRVTLPDSLISIGHGAFTMCKKLKKIVIPDSVVSIGENAFDKSDNVTVFCSKNSFAYEYCVRHKIKTNSSDEDMKNNSQYNDAINSCRQAAEQGDAKYQYLLARCYADVNNIDENPVKAYEWFKKSAEQGYAEAQCHLAFCYALGDGVEADDSKSVFWFKKAAEQDDATAQYELGLLYTKGNGVENDPVQAFNWVYKAAEQGHNLAQYNLANCYKNGNGVEKNMDIAFKWFEESAKRCNGNALFELAICYIDGKGVEQDPAFGLDFFRMLIFDGHTMIKQSFGVIYPQYKDIFEQYLQSRDSEEKTDGEWQMDYTELANQIRSKLHENISAM